ncbi:exported hypothetical protein [Candidatus Sulfopaludibacter sp. SbA4]|nr:exported hypothetical protein [Candidatus Sulfopaludibacter sp. SbA4]
MTAFAFNVGAALLACYGLLILALFAGAMVRALAWRRREHASAAHLPEVREALADYLAGGNDLDRLRSLARAHRHVLAEALMGFRGAIAGAALDRLCGVALELGLVHEWIADTHSRDSIRRRAAYAGLAFVNAYGPCRPDMGDILVLALNDADPEVRLAAAGGTAQSPFSVETARLFESALSQSPLSRILLADVLRHHALALSGSAVPAALGSSDSSRVLAALETLVSWERTIPFDDLLGLLEHPDPRIRIQVLKLAPLVPQDAANRDAILKALTDPDAEVGATAALSAGRLRIAEALPALARLVRVGPAGVARSAASALAAMPPRGWRTLEELSANSSPAAAAVAAEALARARGQAGA